MPQTEFEYYFARSWFETVNTVFLYILTATLIITFSLIIYLANRDYSRLKDELHAELESRFQKQMVELLGQSSFTVPGPDIEADKEYVAAPKEITDPTIDIYSEAFKSKPGSGSDKYADLPDAGLSDIEIDVTELSNLNAAPRGNFSRHPNRTSTAYAEDPGNDLMRDPYTYKIYRDANIYLEIPDYFVATKADYGYRDQNEIMKVIYTKSDIIESCYEKAARMVNVSRGYVKVEFEISYEGYVLPESIKIISSTIRNRNVEQCIKKTISRWRGFEKLDESMGIAHVVHKFVFN